MSNILSAILAAMRAHDDARAAAPDERTRRRITNDFWRAQDQRQQQLAKTFGLLNGWRLTQREFLADDLGTCRRHWEGLPAHPIFYRDPRTRRNIALVAQPYIRDGCYRHPQDWLARLKASYAAQGLRLSVPPNAFASFWYPGWTAFLVVTKRDGEVRWLPAKSTWHPVSRLARRSASDEGKSHDNRTWE